MYCRNCGEQMNENQAICVKCGVKKGDGNRFCANCGAGMDAAASVCMTCGVAAKKSGMGNYDKVTIALVCFFLGGLGIHNFMMGETKKGIVKIVASFLCGLGSILGLVDFIRILMDKYEVNPDAMF